MKSTFITMFGTYNLQLTITTYNILHVVKQDGIIHSFSCAQGYTLVITRPAASIRTRESGIFIMMTMLKNMVLHPKTHPVLMSCFTRNKCLTFRKITCTIEGNFVSYLFWLFSNNFCTKLFSLTNVIMQLWKFAYQNQPN